MKRLNTLAVLGFTLLFFSLSAWSQPITVDGLTYSLQDDEATVTGRASGSTATHITIPDSISYESDNYDVTAIKSFAFPIMRGRLSSVTIGNNVATIGSQAFESNFLTSVTIGDSVTTIGVRAFAGNELTSVTIPDSVTTIGESAFIANSLSSVTIPDSVTSIGASAFGFNALTTVTIGDSVTKIGYDAFLKNALTTVTIPASVTTIEFGAFAENFVTDESGVTTRTLSSVIFNGEYVDWVEDPDGASSIPYGAKEGTGIAPRAFASTDVQFPECVEPAISSFTACPSPSWEGVRLWSARCANEFADEFIAVVQTSEACPFVDPVVLIDELSAFVADLNAKNGILNALDAKLGAVQGALSDLNENNDVAALNAMYAFCYNAQAQSGKQLETADADALIAKADAIIAAIDPTAGLCSE